MCHVYDTKTFTAQNNHSEQVNIITDSIYCEKCSKYSLRQALFFILQDFYVRFTCAEKKNTFKQEGVKKCALIKKETHFSNMGCGLAIARVFLVVVNTLFTVRDFLILLGKTLKQMQNMTDMFYDC